MPTSGKQRRLRQVLFVVVIAALIFFVAGYLAVRFGFWEESPYLMVATIVGGAASLVGMLSLSRPSISAEDIENLEIEALGRVSDLAKQLDDAKRAEAETRGELEQLELQRTQMEASVRRAATILFLREKIARQEERLTEKLRIDRELVDLVETLRTDYEQLHSVGEEIAQDPNVELLSDVIARAWGNKPKPETLQDYVMALSERLLGSVRLG